MNDLSFIRLEPSFKEAKAIGNSPIATILYNDAIQLLTDKTYVQITSTPLGISFDGNYAVYIVDCANNELANITNNVAIEQFTDSNGTPQIKFEITNLGVDFYKKNVFLKFVHTVSSAVWYSNSLIISDYESEFTTRFDYMNYDGTNIMRSISLRCWFETNDAESSSKEYTSINGTKVTSRLILTEFEKYKFDRIDNFTYRRLNAMLSNSIIYVNGYRMTDKVVTASKERKGDTSVFDLEFKIAVNYNETFTSNLQIFEPLTYTSIPTDNGIYNASLSTFFVLTFSRNISITTLGAKAYLYRNGVLVDIAVIQNEDNLLGFPFTYTLDNADYYVLTDENAVTSVIGEVWNGLQLSTDLNFTITDGFYDESYYEETYYLT